MFRAVRGEINDKYNSGTSGKKDIREEGVGGERVKRNKEILSRVQGLFLKKT